MDIAWWRDLMIVLAGASLTLAALVFTVVGLFMAVVVFRRVRKILDSTSTTMGHVEEIARMAREEVAKPVATLTVILRAVSSFVAAFRGIFSGSKDKSKRQPAS